MHRRQSLLELFRDVLTPPKLAVKKSTSLLRFRRLSQFCKQKAKCAPVCLGVTASEEEDDNQDAFGYQDLVQQENYPITCIKRPLAIDK